MNTTSYQACEMSHIYKKYSSAFVCNRAEFSKNKYSGISGVSGNKQFWFVLECQAADFIIIDQAGFRIEAVMHGVKPFSGDACFGAMCKVAAMAEIKPQDGISWLGKSQIDCQVCRGARIGLDIGMFSTKKCFGSGNSHSFQTVAVDLSLVVACSRISFRVFILKNCTAGFQNCFRSIVFAGN